MPDDPQNANIIATNANDASGANASPNMTAPVNFNGDVSDDFRRDVQDAYGSIHPEVRGFLSSQGVTFDAGPTLTHASPDLANVLPHQRSHDMRTHYNQMGAMYNHETNRVAVAEYALRVDSPVEPVVATQQAMQGSILSSDSWERIPSVRETTRHEAYHAVNRNARNETFPLMSESPSFMRAYNADIAAMGGFENAARQGFSYFVRDNSDFLGIAARTEAFAETGAHYAGGALDPMVSTGFPRTSHWMGKFNEGLVSAYRNGSEATQTFINEFGSNAFHYNALELENAVNQARLAGNLIVLSGSKYSYSDIGITGVRADLVVLQERLERNGVKTRLDTSSEPILTIDRRFVAIQEQSTTQTTVLISPNGHRFDPHTGAPVATAESRQLDMHARESVGQEARYAGAPLNSADREIGSRQGPLYRSEAPMEDMPMEPMGGYRASAPPRSTLNSSPSITTRPNASVPYTPPTVSSGARPATGRANVTPQTEPMKVNLPTERASPMVRGGALTGSSVNGALAGIALYQDYELIKSGKFKERGASELTLRGLNTANTGVILIHEGKTAINAVRTGVSGVEGGLEGGASEGFLAAWGSRTGVIGLVITGGMVANELRQGHTEAAARTGTVGLAGIFGGMAAGAIVGIETGPGAVVTAAAGGIMAAMGADMAWDAIKTSDIARNPRAQEWIAAYQTALMSGDPVIAERGRRAYIEHISPGNDMGRLPGLHDALSLNPGVAIANAAFKYAEARGFQPPTVGELASHLPNIQKGYEQDVQSKNPERAQLALSQYQNYLLAMEASGANLDASDRALVAARQEFGKAYPKEYRELMAQESAHLGEAKRDFERNMQFTTGALAREAYGNYINYLVVMEKTGADKAVCDQAFLDATRTFKQEHPKEFSELSEQAKLATTAPQSVTTIADNKTTATNTQVIAAQQARQPRKPKPTTLGR
jgi:hypothetical protein